MSEYRNPAHIEADIEKTREQMSETLNAIQEKFSPGRLVDDVMEYFQSDSAEHFGNNLVDSIKRNPLPVALVGVGLGWLMMSGRNGNGRGYEYPDTSSMYPSGGVRAGSSYRGSSVYGSPSSTTGGAAYTSGTADYTSGTADAGGRSASNMQDLKNKAGGALDSAQQKVSECAHKVSEGAQHIQQKVGEGAHQLQQKMSAGIDELQHQAGDAAAAARYQMHRQVGNIQDGFNYMLREQPLVLIGMGLAIGAALGAGLPSTRREDELMGKTSDNLKAQAATLGKEQLEKAEVVAGAAVDAARDQAGKEQMNDRGIRETVSNAKESVERIAGAAKEAAEKEANKQGINVSSDKDGKENTATDNNVSKKK
jgi:ElaB/YqjD/DUF883 family membrane-anchored ribosome-binding protein